MEKEKGCSKCGFVSEENRQKLGFTLCSVCNTFSPDNPEEMQLYVLEKINKNSIDTFRKYSLTKGQKQKEGMVKKATSGKPMSRPAFGYNLVGGKLVPAENFREVEEIFEEFLREKTSLRKIATKHKFSVNGLKKILTNFTYIGKIKFDNEIHPGSHEPILSTTLFNHVQNKLERLGLK